MTASATVLCNNILLRGKNEHISITPMKLQKLLYYVCVKYAKATKSSPISEPFEVWKFGPVIPSVYAEFKPFRASPITDFARNAKNQAKIVDEDANPILKDCLDYTWRKYKNYSGTELAKRTHQKESGWYTAYQRYGDTISTEEMINDGTI